MVCLVLLKNISLHLGCSQVLYFGENILMAMLLPNRRAVELFCVYMIKIRENEINKKKKKKH